MTPDVWSALCGEYTGSALEAALSQAVNGVSGLDFVRPGMKIGIKANLVSAMNPDRAGTVHPMLVRVLSKMLFEAGAGEVVIGDSPGGLFNSAWLNSVYRATGMQICTETGAVLNENFEIASRRFDGGAVLREFTGSCWLDEVDAIVNVSKLKTHGMMGMSAAVKNMFGAIPGTLKAEYHSRFRNHDDFAGMLVDLNEYYRPALCVCDAVVGMEGNGPTAGTPRMIGAVLASRSPYMLDVCAAEIIGLGPSDVPTLAAAERRGFAAAPSVREAPADGKPHPVLAGDLPRIEDYGIITERKNVDFGNFGSGPVSGLLYRIAGRLTLSKPHVTKSECVGCGKCAKVCPEKTVRISGGKAVINRKNCIRCFCCQEFCPVGAMKVKRSFIGRILVHERKHKKQ